MHERSLRQLWSPIRGAPVSGSPGERVNAAGYRGPELAPWKESGVVRVALLGGAETFGGGVRWQESSAAMLGDRLAAHGVHAEVLDASVAGFTVEQAIERYCELVRPRRADVVVAAFSGINESTPASPVADRLKIAWHTRERHGWACIPMLPSLDLRSVQLLVRFVEQRADSGVLEGNSSGERRARNPAAPSEESGKADWPGLRRVSLFGYTNALERLIRAVRRDGARPILVALPLEPGAEVDSPVLESYASALEQVAQRLSVDFVDARGRFREALREPEPAQLFLERGRLSARGNALLAECLAASVAR
jgi:lysophospholipase L1-like esterase